MFLNKAILTNRSENVIILECEVKINMDVVMPHLYQFLMHSHFITTLFGKCVENSKN